MQLSNLATDLFAMSAPGQSAGDMLSKLEQVRQACLADSSQYIQVVPGIVPILQTAQAVEVRRWGADFMAEAFATPALPGPQKEQLISDTVMALLRGMLETPNEDVAVVKSAVQACASIYPHVFRRVYVESVNSCKPYLIQNTEYLIQT